MSKIIRGSLPHVRPRPAYSGGGRRHYRPNHLYRRNERATDKRRTDEVNSEASLKLHILEVG